MNSLTVHASSSPTSQERIQAIEERFHCAFPREYKTFLLLHNGGQPKPNCFQIYDSKGNAVNESCIHYFLSIDAEEWYADLETFLRLYTSLVADDLLPVAVDPGGNLICIQTCDSDGHGVVFVEIGTVIREIVVSPIAHSFDAFLEGLREYVTYARVDETEFLQACRIGNTKQVQVCIQMGEELEHKDRFGRTPMQVASIYGHLDIVRLLLSTGASSKGSLWYAAQSGNAELVDFLATRGANVNETVDERADTALMIAAALGHSTTVEMLLQHGADVGARNAFGQTAVEQASWADQREIVSRLEAV